MAMVTLTSACNTSLSPNKLREASFSSYLGGSEEAFVRKLAESNRDLSPKITSYGLEEHLFMGGKKEEDGEIGVFGAERYFNADEEENSASKSIPKTFVEEFQCMKGGEANMDSSKAKVQYGTPSIRSESSWNSQSALLQSTMRIPSRRKANKVHGKSLLSGLGCKCYCSDKNSVDVDDEHVGEISFKRPAVNGDAVQGKEHKRTPIKPTADVVKPLAEPWINKDDPFAFPATSPAMAIRPIKVPFPEDEAEKARKSLEVFGSPALGNRNKILNLQRRLKMLSCNANPKPVAEVTQLEPNSIENCNDNDSDASSDLFEIESLTGRPNPFLARRSSDAASGCITPTTCYAPSEVSIEWSVVTASAADFSVISDYEELRSSTALTSPVRTFSTTSLAAKTRQNRELQRRRSGSFLGCNTQKAVKVVGDAYRTTEKGNFESKMRRVSDSSYVPPVTLLAESKRVGVDSRQRQLYLSGR